jgi:phosphoribosylanthranilate isomerase
VRVEIKFCGLTRAEDAAQVAPLGGSYAGVIFAGGPRMLDSARAAAVLAAVGDGVRRVGVFGGQTSAEIVRTVREVGLDVVQLHGDATPELIRRLRDETAAHLWAVVRVGGAENGRGGTAHEDGADIPEWRTQLAALDDAVDAILLDALVPGRLGGTGVTFDWTALTPEARPRHARLVAAGGLTPENVGTAIRTLAPQVVDVSSGVERAPGIKDHGRMRAFADVVRRHCEMP